MSEHRTLFTSEKDFIEMGDERRLTFLFLLHLTKWILSIIFFENRLKLHQYSLVWEVSLGDELQDVKPQV